MFTETVITNEDQHRDAIEEAESLFGSEPGSSEAGRLLDLVDMIEVYETELMIELPAPTTEERAAFRREQMGVGERIAA